ncbi:hypothetical protein FRC17_010909 [Serendipita sp. 399]|nr:hypothetical protein FRC17_010909 [Serendipita sp. 399]
MAAQQQRPPSSETLPAIRSTSPPGSHRTSGRAINESMTLPPIHNLTRELPSRLEPLHGDSHPSQRHSPPDSNGYHRKRAATGGIAGDMSPSSAFKRRRVDSSESTDQNSEPPHHSAPGSASESHIPRQGKPPQEQHDTQHLSPPLGGTPDMPTPKAVSRDAFPAIPTPTSLRLRSVLQPPLPPANPNLPPATSPSGRGPITPAVPSPIPTLGSGTGLADKAKFMAKMSEIYDKASLHRNCVTLEDVDKRIREALASRDHEILQLKKEVFELRKSSKGPAPANAVPGAAVDHDGDVTMGGNNNSTTQPRLSRVHSRQPSRTLSVSPRPSPHPVEPTKESATAPPNAKSPEQGATPSITMPSALPMANGKISTSTNSPDAPAASAVTVKE